MQASRSIRSEQPPTNARGRRTRTALLAAARALLEESGFDALTMASVAERAGVTRRAVYLHFASRSELVTALFVYVAEQEGMATSVEQVHAAPDAPAAVDAWARLEATYHVRILGVARAIEHMRRVGRDDPDAAAWRDRIMEFQVGLCRSVAQRLAHERRLAADWTCETAADLLWALMSTEPLERLLRDRHWTSEQYEARLAKLLRATLVAEPTR
jgi:AcrR family transcriptional regulator